MLLSSAVYLATSVGCCQRWHGLKCWHQSLGGGGGGKGKQSASKPGSWQHFPQTFPLLPGLLPGLAWLEGSRPVAFSTLFHSCGPGSCCLPTVWKYYIVQFNVCILKNKLKDSSVYKAYII